MKKYTFSFILACAVLVITACGNGSSSSPTPTAYTVSGSISGLTSGSLVLKNNDADPITLSANTARFTFPTPILDGAAYAVSVGIQPSGLTCAVSNGSGVINSANVNNVNVVCSATTYTLGGTVSGLVSGTLSLQNNGGASINLVSSGAFVFPDALPEGAAYNVTVASQPTGLACAISNGAGNIGAANVSSIAVSCGSTTLVSSVATLALATSGVSRVFNVTNTGSIAAQNLAINTSSALPTGTSIASTCSNSLAPGSSCTVTITPGATASGSAGSAPTPSSINITASNANTVMVDVAVLGLGNIYQGGYIFAIDDTTSPTSSIGGKVAALTDQMDSTVGIVWGPSGSAVLGVNENSTTPCRGSSNGQCNTTQIVTMYAGTPLTTYAAGLCTATISGYSDWYLPAICELGPDNGAGRCVNGTPNMLTNLAANGIGGLEDRGFYWSSTQDSTDAPNKAWYEYIDVGVNGVQIHDFKLYPLNVRCARALTY